MRGFREGADDYVTKPFGLLELIGRVHALMRRAGKASVVGRLELLREVWGYGSDVVSRTVDTHVGELRRKLEKDPAAPRHILTVRKTGYRLHTG